MKLPLLFLFLLGGTVTVAGQEAAATESGDTALMPVNGMSRFLLTDTLPHLAGSLDAATSGVVVLRTGEFRLQPDDTIVTQMPQARGKDSVWVQMNDFWIEPVTPPPSSGESLIVPIDDMRIAELQGEVTLTPPAAKGTHVKAIDANEDMEVADYSTISTADSGSAAIMIGGHTSVRLVPNSKVVFHYDSTTATPCVDVQILQGGVFCKVGRLTSGHVPDVAIRGKTGAVANIGCVDMFVEADPASLHACLVDGKILMGNAIPTAVGNMAWYPADAEATPASGPQIVHWPKLDAGTSQHVDAQILGLALHAARELNVKIKLLVSAHDAPLSSDDQTYLAHIPRITWYAQASANPATLNSSQ